MLATGTGTGTSRGHACAHTRYVEQTPPMAATVDFRIVVIIQHRLDAFFSHRCILLFTHILVDGMTAYAGTVFLDLMLTRSMMPFSTPIRSYYMPKLNMYLVEKLPSSSGNIFSMTKTYGRSQRYGCGPDERQCCLLTLLVLSVGRTSMIANECQHTERLWGGGIWCWMKCHK